MASTWGREIYNMQTVETGTPASLKGPTRLGFPSSEAHPPAGVGDRFSQMIPIVDSTVLLLLHLVLLFTQSAQHIAQYPRPDSPFRPLTV